MKNLDKTDRRVERTRSAIINAFKEMIIEKDFKQITIKELAERADINRKTFYLHYESMEEILFDLSIELSDQIFESLNDRDFFNPDCYDINILVECIDGIINSNYELTRKIISSDSYRFFSRNIRDLVKDSFIRKIRGKIKVNEYIMNLVSDYVASGFAKVLKDWFEDHGDLSSKDIAELASIIIFADIKAGLQFYERKQTKTSQ